MKTELGERKNGRNDKNPAFSRCFRGQFSLAPNTCISVFGGLSTAKEGVIVIFVTVTAMLNENRRALVSR